MPPKAEKHLHSLDTYRAYLIRIWQDGHQATWRASAQAVQSGEVKRFANLMDLFAFLEAQTVDASEKVE